MTSLRDQIASKIAPHMRGVSWMNADSDDVERNRQNALKVADAILKLIEPRGESELREALEKIESASNYGVNDPGEALLECGNLAAAALSQALATPSAPVSGLVAEIDALFQRADDVLRRLRLELWHCADQASPGIWKDENWAAKSKPAKAYVDAASLRDDLHPALSRLKSALASRDEWRPMTPQVIDELASSGQPFFGGLWVNNNRTGTKYFEKTFIYLSERETEEGAPYYVPLVCGTDDETGWDLDDYEYYLPFTPPTPPTSQERKS